MSALPSCSSSWWHFFWESTLRTLKSTQRNAPSVDIRQNASVSFLPSWIFSQLLDETLHNFARADLEQEFALQPSRAVFQPRFVYNSVNLKHCGIKKSPQPALRQDLFLYSYSRSVSEAARKESLQRSKNQLASNLSKSTFSSHINDIKSVYMEGV